MNKRLLYKYNLRKQSYLLKKLQKIRNNKSITNINDISKEEINTILSLIKKEVDLNKITIIKNAVESEYNNMLLKVFINKDKYIKKHSKFYLDIINTVSNKFKSTYDIDNNLEILYCYSQIRDMLNVLLNKHNEDKLLCLMMIIKIRNIQKFYSDVLKELYKNNKEELIKIYNYEKIDINYNTNKLNKLSKNVKTLTHNVNNKI